MDMESKPLIFSSLLPLFSYPAIKLLPCLTHVSSSNHVLLSFIRDPISLVVFLLSMQINSTVNSRYTRTFCPLLLVHRRPSGRQVFPRIKAPCTPPIWLL